MCKLWSSQDFYGDRSVTLTFEFMTLEIYLIHVQRVWCICVSPVSNPFSCPGAIEFARFLSPWKWDPCHVDLVMSNYDEISLKYVYSFGKYKAERRSHRQRDARTDSYNHAMAGWLPYASGIASFGGQWLMCDFLLVINSNLPAILHRFGDIALERSKIVTFFYPSLV